MHILLKIFTYLLVTVKSQKQTLTFSWKKRVIYNLVSIRLTKIFILKLIWDWSD